MKIISFNIGIKIDNAKASAEYLKDKKADIICLQETVRPLEEGIVPIFRSEEIIINFLKKDYPYYFFAPEWVADKFTKNNEIYKDFKGMVEQGKLILSKYPIIHGYNYFYHKNYEFDCNRTNFYEGNDHGRALQVCEIDINGNVIQIGNVYGTYTMDKKDTEKTIEQSEFILKKLKSKNLSTILLGDFNILPDTKSVQILNKEYQNLNDVFNVSSTRQDKKMVIDYIFIDKNFLAKNLSIDMIDISDHYPLIVELDLK